MKKKGKSKRPPLGDDNPLPSSSIAGTSPENKPPVKIPSIFLKHKRYWLIPAVSIAVIILTWQLSQSWLVQASFSQARTAPKVSVLGENVGDLDISQLNSRLANLKENFEAKEVTFVKDNQKWTFNIDKLGATFDVQATSQSVLRLNKLSVIDRLQLLTSGAKSVVEPTVQVNNEQCVKSLSIISISQTKAKDAAVYFDQGLKIEPDVSGTKFNPASTCQGLSKQLATNEHNIAVTFDVTKANITKSDLDSKLAQIQSLVGKPLSLMSGNYQTTLTSESLMGLLQISKNSSGVHIDWSSTKLDKLINGIATRVGVSNSYPKLGACQYLSSIGGHWLDKAATKKIFSGLETNSSRSYDLPIIYYAPVIGTHKPVKPGANGTIYLTFDDGLTHGNQIMNYAACYHIKVTFFEIGSKAAAEASLLRRAIAEGHAVQSHGYIHAIYDYGERSYSWQNNDIKQSISVIMGITSVRPSYFRPPGGNRSANTYKAATANGVNLILWGDASRDSTPGGIGSAATCANVLAGAYPGASVLMHSTNKSTADAVPCIVEGLAARGYNMQALR